jgi:hypothetical protein
MSPRARNAEDRLDAALREQLPEPHVVYRNVAWLTKADGDEPRDGEADFVVAHPELGILVIEVKGGGIRRTGGRWESVDRGGTTHAIKDPFAQVTREMHSLRRLAADRPDWPAHEVRFCRAVAFPDIRYETALQPDGPREIVIDADDLASVHARIREIFDWWAANPEAGRRGGAPTAIGMKALHSLLGQDVEIPSPLQLQLAEDERQIIRLSAQQFDILNHLRAQRRALILGVAGSGKTLLAAEQTRRMAEAGHRVLLTCFNRPLAEYLRASIGTAEGVDVFTFHGLAEELATRAGVTLNKRHDDPTYFDVDLPQALADAVERLPEHRYDAVVVDEAQDIDAVWWLPLLDLLADREHGRLFVFGDANQDLYHADADEIGVVMPDRPPVYLLEENRRTTRAIHDWAQRWAAARPISTDDGPLDFHPRAVGPEGRPVQVLAYPDGDADACRRAVASVLKELVGPGGGVRARDIAVLTPRSPRSSWLAGAKVGSYTLVSEAGPEGAPMPPPTSAWEIRLSTIHRFKGLESPVVILAEVDSRVPIAQLPGLLYVGATRARTHLVVIGSEATLQ